ncbi:hypothetical protein PEV8663_04794 [Pelagimonas varians]|uniref:Uncharacterized protein n=1 Tax=Pelagimonas varians TaxID=696760 RepID=A0A238L6Y6_9RHOB|nr:hypothetical protein PEV8663_04794 [Pelagimonas varians]
MINQAVRNSKIPIYGTCPVTRRRIGQRHGHRPKVSRLGLDNTNSMRITQVDVFKCQCSFIREHGLTEDLDFTVAIGVLARVRVRVGCVKDQPVGGDRGIEGQPKGMYPIVGIASCPRYCPTAQYVPIAVAQSVITVCPVAIAVVNRN